MKNRQTRIEQDSMGEVELPADALYGPQTQRALNNFTIQARPLPPAFIAAVIYIKKTAAIVNIELGLLAAKHGQAIIHSCNELLEGKHNTAFPVSIYQTGSGTSTNMNINEVIATLVKKHGLAISPNDHVNLGQSSNDVIPSAIHLSTTLALHKTLLPALDSLINSIREKGEEYSLVIKTGRTHLMDALPIRLQDEFEAWAIQLEECRERIEDGLKRFKRLPLGGTAIGSGINCHPDFAGKAIFLLSEITGITFSTARSNFKGLSSMDSALEISGSLKTLAMVLMKISNDLRWMNSGPLAGLGEITLPSLQPGSSIMPAKVNPVIPEAVCMAAAQVAGYDTAITIAAQSGNFQLNTMLPLIATNLLDAVEILGGSCNCLAEKAICGLVVNVEKCAQALEKNPILATALNPEIGYLRAAEVAKTAAAENRSVLSVALEQTEIPEKRLQELLNPAQMAGQKKS